MLSLFVDKPKFLCSGVVYVKLLEPNYDLVCKVHANPDVQTAHITFLDPYDDNSTVNVGIPLEGSENEDNGDYKANVTVGVSIIQVVVTKTYLTML